MALKRQERGGGVAISDVEYSREGRGQRTPLDLDKLVAPRAYTRTNTNQLKKVKRTLFNPLSFQLFNNS